MPGIYGTRRSKPVWVSQNYLTSSEIIRKIIKKTNLNSSDHVIEIGPGKGHITKFLVARCMRVTAIEIDPLLYARLKEKFSGSGNLCLRLHDFLKWNLPVNGSYKVFSNIPFNRTTEIIRKLTGCPNPPKEAWLVVEKGAAKRFIGKPNETLHSLFLKTSFNAEIVYYFKREDFHPMPGVDAVLLHLAKKEIPDLTPCQKREFLHFISQCFAYGNAGLRRYFTAGYLRTVMQKAGINKDIILREILYIQWLCLFRYYRHLE